MRPVLVVPPAADPVTLAEAKAQVGVTEPDWDRMLDGMIGAATAHLDGYGGILGRCLVEQVWRQDFRTWGALHLPFPDARDVTVSFRDAQGAAQDVDPGAHWIDGDAAGPVVRFRSGWACPGLDGDGPAPVAVTFTAGYGAPHQVPASIRAAILMHVAGLFANREGLAETDVITTRAYRDLIAPHRAVRP